MVPFAHVRRNMTTIRVSFATSGVYLKDKAAGALTRDRSDDGIVGFEVRIYSRVLFDAGIWRVKRRLLRGAKLAGDLDDEGFDKSLECQQSFCVNSTGSKAYP
ncbi:hypothetical protein QQ045_022602 [Rhodiola kirilowii]